jgi:hypothetical protein
MVDPMLIDRIEVINVLQRLRAWAVRVA